MPSNRSIRRRRHIGSTARRYTPAEVVRATRVRHRIGAMEIAGAIGAFVIAAALIVLVWMVASRTIQDQREQVRDVVQRNLLGQATIMARAVGHELHMIDQSLTVLQQAWNADSAQFDINKWKAQMPALMEVTDDLFIADDKRIIRQDILPQAVGQAIASAYVSWPHGSLEKLGDTGPQIGVPLGAEQDQAGTEARRFIMYVVRPLPRPPGWVLGASFRTEQLGKLFSGSWFGPNALAAIIDMQNGGLQTIIGSAARRPQRGLAKTELFTAMTKAGSGVWTGISPIDSVQRLLAFARVPNRDMAVVVGATEAEAMAPADTFAAGVRGVAFAASGTVLACAAIVAWGFYRFRANRRREAARLREASELERLRQDEARLAERAQLQAARLRSLVENVSDGVALADPELRIIRWNRRFEQGIGVPLQENMPLDAVLRQQAALGLFTPLPEDVEVEIARRVVALRSGDEALPQLAIGYEDRFLRGLPIAEGGLILLLTGVGNLPVLAPEAEEPLMEPIPAAAPVEW